MVTTASIFCNFLAQTTWLCDPNYSAVITVSCTLCTVGFVINVHRQWRVLIRSELSNHILFLKTDLHPTCEKYKAQIKPDANGRKIYAFFHEVQKWQKRYERDTTLICKASKWMMGIWIGLCILCLFFGFVNRLSAALSVLPIFLTPLAYFLYWGFVRCSCWWKKRPATCEVRKLELNEPMTVDITGMLDEIKNLSI